jgi:BASS family bile acid:Na+ symporter
VETLKQLLPLIMQLSLALLVAAVGLQSRWGDIVYAFRRPALLVRGIIAVDVVPPIVAAVLVAILPLPDPVKVGIVLMAVSPLAPFAPSKMLKAGAENSFAVGLYVALMLLAVVTVPLAVYLLSRVFGVEASIAPAAIANLVLTSVLLPLLIGLAIGSLAPALAEPAARIAKLVGNIGLLVFIVPVLIVLAKPMLALVGDGALLSIVLVVSSGLAAGHLLGGPEQVDRMALAFAAATRHPGMAFLIAKTNFDNPKVVPAEIMFLLTGIVVSSVYQALMKSRHPAPGHVGA